MAAPLPRVFMDLTADGQPIGKVIFEVLINLFLTISYETFVFIWMLIQHLLQKTSKL